MLFSHSIWSHDSGVFPHPPFFFSCCFLPVFLPSPQTNLSEFYNETIGRRASKSSGSTIVALALSPSRTRGHHSRIGFLLDEQSIAPWQCLIRPLFFPSPCVFIHTPILSRPLHSDQVLLPETIYVGGLNLMQSRAGLFCRFLPPRPVLEITALSLAFHFLLTRFTLIPPLCTQPRSFFFSFYLYSFLSLPWQI